MDLAKIISDPEAKSGRWLGQTMADITERAYSTAVRYKWNLPDKLRVAHVCPHIDPATVGMLHAYGMNESVADVAVRQIRGTRSPLDRHSDLIVGRDDDEIHEVLDQADIIHCNMVYPDSAKSKLNFIPWLTPAKKFLMHFHGGPWSWDLAKVAEWREQYGMQIVTCAPNMKAVIPDARWMPNLIPLDPYFKIRDCELYQPRSDWPNDPSPTRFLSHHAYATGKGCDVLRQVFSQISSVYGLRPDVSIHDAGQAFKLAAHLEHKKGFDVVIDQLTQGFIGMAGWESLAQAAMVIARVDGYAARAYCDLGGGTCPIQNVGSVDELAVLIIRCVNDREFVRDTRQAGYEWMLKYYNVDRIAGIWAELYRGMVSAK